MAGRRIVGAGPPGQACREVILLKNVRNGYCFCALCEAVNQIDMQYVFLYCIKKGIKWIVCMSELSVKKNNASMWDSLVGFNIELERNSSAGKLNERYLMEMMLRLHEIHPWDPDGYWLTMARLNELALFCAGNYADAGEFQAAGDLLVNPRRVVVHAPNHAAPVVKERHTPLTLQFADDVPYGEDAVTWLKMETSLEIEEPALLPWFLELLTCAECFSSDYLESVLERQKRISSTLVFAAACKCPETMDFQVYRLRADSREKEFIESNLCLFDKGVFDLIGRDLRIMAEYPAYRSPFLLRASG